MIIQKARAEAQATASKIADKWDFDGAFDHLAPTVTAEIAGKIAQGHSDQLMTDVAIVQRLGLDEQTTRRIVQALQQAAIERV